MTTDTDDFDFGTESPTNGKGASPADLLGTAKNLVSLFEAFNGEDSREELFEAIEELDELLTGNHPPMYSPLVFALREFAGEAGKLSNAIKDVVSASNDIAEQVSSMEGPPPLEPLKPLESIPKLVAESVSYEQIARMYGFVDRNGVPLQHLVTRELALPGSVIGPEAKGKGLIDGKDWAGDPREIDRDHRYGKDWRNRVPVPVVKKAKPGKSDGSSRKSRAQAILDNMNGVSSAPRACPETPRDLFDQGVNPEQASRMLGSQEWTVHAVAEQWKEWDLERAQNQKKRAAEEAMAAAGIGAELVGAGAAGSVDQPN